MSAFYKIEHQDEERVVIQTAQRIHAPEYTLDATDPAHHNRTDGGWTYYATPAAFLNGTAVKEATAALHRTQLIDAGAEMPDLDPHFGLPVPVNGLPWVQPQGVLGAYREGATVTHEGGSWASTVPYNVWEPGVYGWSRTDGEEPGGPDVWVQPQGTVGMYARGAVVTHNGRTWISDVDNNVWEPGVYGWTAQGG